MNLEDAIEEARRILGRGLAFERVISSGALSVLTGAAETELLRQETQAAIEAEIEAGS